MAHSRVSLFALPVCAREPPSRQRAESLSGAPRDRMDPNPEPLTPKQASSLAHDGTDGCSEAQAPAALADARHQQRVKA